MGYSVAIDKACGGPVYGLLVSQPEKDDLLLGARGVDLGDRWGADENGAAIVKTQYQLDQANFQVLLLFEPMRFTFDDFSFNRFY